MRMYTLSVIYRKQEYTCLIFPPFAVTLASCLIYARAFIEYMLPSVKFAEDKVLTFLILRENAKIVQP